ncbi:MAG: 3'-5' exonuclease [Eubacteriales bacterium]|nr:3'-5' exonuclease [Eubacteriales bacterium]
MHYIVVDFEWNQPISFNSKSFKQVEDKLLFEIIEIGAVKLDQNFHILATFEQTIQPTYFTKIHPRIRRITNLGAEELKSSPKFPSAYEQFKEFCGDDPHFITWGSEDVSVYKQNLDCFELQYEPLNFYNLQRMFAQEYKTTNKQPGLKNGMDLFQIEEDESHPFHNALNDAYYTAIVLQHMENKAKITDYPQNAKKLVHQSKLHSIHVNHQVLSVKHALNGHLIQQATCPACKQACSLESELISQSPVSYIALCKCPTHGYLFLQARFGKLRNRNIGLALSLIPAGPEHKQYIKAKRYQNNIDTELNRPVIDLPDFNGYGSFPFEDE